MKFTLNLYLSLAILSGIFMQNDVAQAKMRAFDLPADCTNPTNGGTIGADQIICADFDLLEITNELPPSGESGTLEYKWQSSVSPFDTWTDIASNTATYTPGTITETKKYKRIARVNCKHEWIGAAESNVVTITVIPLVADAGPINGRTQLIQGATGVPYSVAAIANADFYAWEYSGTGVNIIGDGREVTLDFAADATPGTLTVYGINDCGFGTESSLDISLNNKFLNVKVFLEGPFDGTSAMNTTLNPYVQLTQPYDVAPWNYAGTENVESDGIVPDGVVDWVLVELRDAATPTAALPATIISGWPKAFFLKSDGTIVDLDGISQPNIGNLTVANNLYVVIRHRNHLAIMSANGATLNAGVYSYDFTTGLDKAYGGGSGYKQVSSKFAMVSGDIDNDGNIFVSDFNNWAVEFGTTNGYMNSDIDMDGSTFVSDFNKWAINFGSTIDNTLKSAQLKPEQGKSKFSSMVPK
jgi:hypothetical protein